MTEKNRRSKRRGAFTDNMKLPIHRWFRFSAGYSSEWVSDVIRNNKCKNPIILDPFAGSGTTLLAANSENAGSIGFEQHPMIYRIAKSKLSWNSVDLMKYQRLIKQILAHAKTLEKKRKLHKSPLITKCFTEDSNIKLIALRDAYLKKMGKNSEVDDLVWLTLTSILRSCSFVGTAPWQYILPNKRKARVKDPYDAFIQMADLVVHDINLVKETTGTNAKMKMILTDARNPKSTRNPKANLVITSPPYPNNYDYADSTRFELTFWNKIVSWSDLHEVARKKLVRSCSQHSAKERLELDKLLNGLVDTPIYEEIKEVCEKLAKIRLERAGRKTYHTMIAAYYLDLYNTFKSLKKITTDDVEMYFVIGDSAPYGIYAPADKWLGKLAISAGFSSFDFEKLRDRNTKWKNRKHRVLLKEGILKIT